MKRIPLIILLTIPLLYGCATQTQTVKEQDNVHLLMDKLNAYNSAISTIEAEALLLYTENDKTYSFRAEIAVHNNGEKIRLDLADFVFKKPVLTIFKNNNEVTALLHTKKKVYITTYENLSIEELSGIKLRKEILLPALMGKVFLDTAHEKLTSPDPDTLIIESNGFWETVSFDSNMLPHSIEYKVGSEVYSVSFRSFTSMEGVFFPEKVTLTNLNRQLEAAYKDVAVNGTIDAARFLLDKESLTEYAIEAL